MGRRGTPLHESTLQSFKHELEQQGARVILLRALSPDGIAVFPDGRICAIEALGKHHRTGKGWHAGWSFRGKARQYSMFDEVLIKPFNYPRKVKSNA
jgi:hypothetical protein